MEPPQRPPPKSDSKFPWLEVLDSTVPRNFIKPGKRINDESDVNAFLTSKAYRDIGVFVMQLNRAMCPRKTKGENGKESIQCYHLGSEYEKQPTESVQKLQNMLAKIESFIDETPPDPGPRRFGNISFRKWYQILEEKKMDIFQEYLPASALTFGASPGVRDTSAVDEISAYFLGSFGSAQRLDYGTGHELSFLAFLGCLWKLNVFQDDKPDGNIERNIVLGAFEPYLRVVRRLILTYNLEPAGSHGVWGLDDHSFQPYIYGSAQLTRPITDDEPMPLEGSFSRAPKPSSAVKGELVGEERKRNMYFSAIGFINDVKKGPFWEHSPILFDISGVRDGWGKINKGMIKMFNAEVLSKFPVVQHFHFGSLFSWEQDPNAIIPPNSIQVTSQSPLSQQGMGTATGTAAPWAQPTGMPTSAGPGIPYSRMPRPGAQSASSPIPPQSMPQRSSTNQGQAPWARPSDRPGG